MNSDLSFLCIGSVSLDVYLRNINDLAPVCANPEDCFYHVHLGDKIYVNKMDQTCGGGASNASVTFARGGHRTYFMGLLGSDPAGATCLASMTREGINTEHVSYTKKYNTDYSTLLLAPNGERTILTYRGCGNHINPKTFDFSKINEPVNWIYMTSMVGNFEVYDQIIDFAKKVGAKIAFNPGGAELKEPEKLKKVLQHVEILSVNKEEAQMIVRGDTIEDLIRGLRQYCPVVIITDGVFGSVASNGDQSFRAGLYRPTDIAVDRTGAGDAFCSGFTMMYAMTGDVKKSMHYASANSSSVVMAVGAKTAILHAADRDNLTDMDIQPIKL